MKQYSKRIATIHWLTLILFVAALYLGHELDEAEGYAAKVALYPYHFFLGDLILILTLIRTYFMRKDGKPAPLEGGKPLANKVATGLQHLLYVLLIALPVSGMVMINTTGLMEAIKANDPGKMPDLEQFMVHEVHAAIVGIIVLTIALHVAAALFHQFILKDNIIRRIALKRFED